MVRKNKDGSLSVGILTDKITPADVKTADSAKVSASPDVKTEKPKTTRRSVKK